MERRKVRIVSFAIAVLAVLLGALLYQFYVSQAYYNYIRQNNTRAFYDLLDNVKNIDTSLEKGIYTSTPEQFSILSAEIWKDASGAQASLAQLPISSDQSEKVMKFLSQSGDYAYMLSKKVINSEQITPAEQQQMEQLSGYAKVLVSSLQDLEDDINKGNFNINDMNTNKDLSVFNNTSASQLNTVKEEFDDYPTLIYDGPFSDHIEKLQPEVLKNLQEITIDDARSRAASYLGVDISKIIDNGLGEGNIKTYSFKYDVDKNTAMNIDITRIGGYPLYILSNIKAPNKNLTIDDAKYRALEYLKVLGIENMEQSYYYELDNIVTINFAYLKDGITYYSDLIKVSVSLDDGQIIGIETKNYLMTHKQRSFEGPFISTEDARAKLNAKLIELKHKMAVIPTDYGTEVYCHEFLCQNSEGQRFLVYINANTGKEEKMFLLVVSENGTLTM